MNLSQRCESPVGVTVAETRGSKCFSITKSSNKHVNMGVTRCIKCCGAVIDGWIAVIVAWCVCSDTLSGVLGNPI